MDIKNLNGKRFDPNWINTGMTKDAVDYSEELGKELATGYDKEKMTTSQVRNFFGEMRRIQLKGFDTNKPAFFMLKPKLAYAVARADKNNKIKYFKEVTDILIDMVNTKEHFNNLVNFMEAIVAYHKANGGK